MFLILAGTFPAGLITIRSLLIVDVRYMPVRCPLAVIAAYFAFFGYVGLWLVYIDRSRKDRDSFLDIEPLSSIDTPADCMPHPLTGPFAGGGGDFS
ncbi:MAG: hypothetical protein OEW04_10405 [Nitrospirota bacterium]|nr:hypothetical protein [Nitrospirota bacterium]